MLNARPFCHMTLIHAICPENLTGTPNGEGREDKTYILSKKKNRIHRAVNSTLTYALSHGGYRIKYRVAWHGGVIIMHSLGPDWRHDKLVSVLWRTWFAASTQPILLSDGF